MTINVIDQSEPVYGVRIGDRINVWISRATKDFMENYNPEGDMDSPDWEGTIDHPDLCSPDEPDMWDEVR